MRGHLRGTACAEGLSMKLGTLLPCCLRPAHWWPNLVALRRRWSRAGRSGELSGLAPRRPAARGPAARGRPPRIHPAVDQFEQRFHPNDPLGLLHTALWGAGAGLLLADISVLGTLDGASSPGGGAEPSPDSAA